MKLLIIVGPKAVGKMTVGYELEKLTDLKLFHNHMAMELIHPFFGYNSEVGKRLITEFRDEIFKEFASANQEGMIFTYVWCFDDPNDWRYINRISNIFKENQSEIFFVELKADLGVRIERNKTPFRLQQKPSKRNIEYSERRLLESEHEHRTNSLEGEIKEKNYILINNTDISASDAAMMIKERFNL